MSTFSRKRRPRPPTERGPWTFDTNARHAVALATAIERARHKLDLAAYVARDLDQMADNSAPSQSAELRAGPVAPARLRMWRDGWRAFCPSDPVASAVAGEDRS